MNGTALDYALENYTFDLKSALDGILAGNDRQELYFRVMFDYRVLAISALLLEADATRFAQNLSKSGSARLHFLELAAKGLQATPKYICSSKNIGFTAALAAGDIDVAKKAALLSPIRHFPEIEYEDNFLFFHFLQRHVCDESSRREREVILQRWETVLEGEASGYYDACQGLQAEMPDDFAAGFDSLLATRRAQLDEYRETVTCDKELLATEGCVFIEGLAVLRIAESIGLAANEEYDLIPSVARVPIGMTLPDPDAWKKL